MSKRLTYKLDEPIETKYLHYDYKRIADYDISRGNYGRITDADIYNKLGQLEDIEEELGIDLITLFKALEEGIYTIRSNSKRRYPFLTYNGAVGYILDFQYEQEAQYILSDYGKTWALTKEELEEDE